MGMFDNVVVWTRPCAVRTVIASRASRPRASLTRRWIPISSKGRLCIL
jgi:hypothetical protein